MRIFTLIFVLVLSLQCTNKKLPKGEPTLEGSWQLVELTGFEYSLEGANGNPVLIVKLDAKTYNGHTGCNSMSGTLLDTKSGIRFSDALMTRMACNDEGLEQAYLIALRSFTSYRFEGSRLVLMDNDKTLAVFEPRK
ncbi:MAG: META domain-containing protein [Bacteroidota bacterium]|nr:MAG: META domain-containing protein [Bacteroidota bacterium]